MRILISGINYSPELTGIGKYTGELAEWLAARGHEVRVVTASPYYPDWKVQKPYSSYEYSKETIDRVQVYRCPLWVPSKPSGIKRLLHLISFALTSAPVMIFQVFWKPDVVLTIEPPLFCAPVALLTAKLAGAKSALHIQDFELDAAFDLGLLKGNFSKKVALFFERHLLNSFDLVSTISQKMIEKLKVKGIKTDKSLLFQNWVDLDSFAISNNSKAVDFRSKLGISPDAVVAMYSGNMGNKQGLEILAEVARLCEKDNPKVIFVFCGAGASKAALVQSCAGLNNVYFMDLQPLEYLPSLLQMADIHLLPQRSEVEDLVMPSKLTGMLASSRPVITNASPHSALASVVSQCGLVVESSHAKPFALAVQKLASDINLRTTLGASGRQYAQIHFDKERILSSFEAALKQA